jgi:hypothetical protein
MSKNGKKGIIPKTIGQYVEEQSKKSKKFRKAYDRGKESLQYVTKK